jgi:hypothetical protein
MPSPSHVRNRRLSNPATSFPSPIEPGELAINTAARQLHVGDADPAFVGAPLQLLGVRIFDVRGIYAVGDYVTNAGYLYRCKAVHGPAVFNATHFELIAGVDAAASTLNSYLLLTGGTLTGPLLLPIAAPAANAEAANKKYVDDQIANVVLGNVSAGTIINTPAGNISATTAQDAINELDTEKVAKAGDAMTGLLALPTTVPNANNAVRRDYVDSAVNALQQVDSALQSSINTRVALAGDIMTGLLGLPATAPGPTNAVRRDYVDGKMVIATGAEFIGNLAGAAAKIISPATVWAAAAPIVLLDTAAVAPDFSLGIDFVWQMMAAGRVINNPLNIKPGQKGMFYLVQGVAGASIGTWGSYYKFTGGIKPVLSTSVGAVDAISYSCRNATEVHCFFAQGMA